MRTSTARTEREIALTRDLTGPVTAPRRRGACRLGPGLDQIHRVARTAQAVCSGSRSTPRSAGRAMSRRAEAARCGCAESSPICSSRITAPKRANLAIAIGFWSGPALYIGGRASRRENSCRRDHRRLFIGFRAQPPLVRCCSRCGEGDPERRVGMLGAPGLPRRSTRSVPHRPAHGLRVETIATGSPSRSVSPARNGGRSRNDRWVAGQNARNRACSDSPLRDRLVGDPRASCTRPRMSVRRCAAQRISVTESGRLCATQPILYADHVGAEHACPPEGGTAWSARGDHIRSAPTTARSGRSQTCSTPTGRHAATPHGVNRKRDTGAASSTGLSRPRQRAQR